MGCNVGLKVMGKEVGKWFGNVELIDMKAMEPPSIDQNDKKATNTLTPNNIVPQVI